MFTDSIHISFFFRNCFVAPGVLARRAVRQAVRVDWLWGIAAVAIMGLLAWAGFRIEPHWVSKDGHRFLCSGQLLSHLGEPLGRWRETRIIVDRDGQIQVDQKRLLRRKSSMWALSGESPDPPKRRSVFLLRGHDADGQTRMLALRLPTKSRAIPVLRDVMQRR